MEERSRSPRSGWTLFQCGGSAVLRALPYTLLATLLSALLHFPLESKVNFLRQEWQDPYPFNAFVLVLALIVLLRCGFILTATRLTLLAIIAFRHH